MISPEPGINSPQVETASDWQIGTLRKVKQALDEYCHSISIKELRSPATLQGELLDTDFTFALAARPESVFLQFSGHKGGKPLPVQTFNLGPAPEVPTPYSRTYEVIVEHIVYLIERSG